MTTVLLRRGHVLVRRLVAGRGPLQIHTTQGDPWSEMDALEQLASEAANAELFVYRGSGHLFAEAGGEDYDEGGAGLLKERVLRGPDRRSRLPQRIGWVTRRTCRL